MIRVLIVDDEPLALERLVQGFAGAADVEIVGTATDGVEALARIEALAPDLVILDMQMPGCSGLEVARALVGPDRPQVAFVTAYEQYVAEALALGTVDYLVKPVRFDRLRQTIARTAARKAVRQGAAEPVRDAGPEIVVTGADGAVALAVGDIVWCEAGRSHVLLHLALESVFTTDPLGPIEAALGCARAMRVSRSALVNSDAVAEAVRGERDQLMLTLTNGGMLPVGSNYAPSVVERLGARVRAG